MWKKLEIVLSQIQTLTWPTLFLAGLEYNIPFMADICSSSMGVSYLDHPIRTVVLYGLLAGTCDLCWVVASCPVRLWPPADWWWVTTAGPNWNIWLCWAGTEEMAISLSTLGCSSKILGSYVVFVRSFRRAYKRRGLYPRRLITRINKNALETSYSSADHSTFCIY